MPYPFTVAHATRLVTSISFKAKPRYTIKGDIGLPTVDILILACGQDVSMIVDSAVACARLDWPLDKLRVLVIDENASLALQRSVEHYAHTRAIHVTYHKRSRQSIMINEKNPNMAHKSSTINFGLAETRAEGRISGEYVVILEGEVGAVDRKTGVRKGELRADTASHDTAVNSRERHAAHPAALHAAKPALRPPSHADRLLQPAEETRAVVWHVHAMCRACFRFALWLCRSSIRR